MLGCTAQLLSPIVPLYIVFKKKITHLLELHSAPYSPSAQEGAFYGSYW